MSQISSQEDKLMASVDSKSRVMDMQSLGLSPQDLVPSGPLSSRRALARAQTAQIMSKKFIQRDRIKQKMKEEEERAKLLKKMEKSRNQSKYKISSSPFGVNLVADSERLEEEYSIRIEDEARRRKLVEQRTRSAQQDVLLRALQEESDLEALRREKRAIMEEERRLKALLDLEKTNSHAKADRMAAVRAEKLRHATKAEYRRQQNMAAIADLRERERSLLVMKHDVPEPTAAGTFGVPNDSPLQNVAEFL